MFVDNGAADDALDGTDTKAGEQTVVNIGSPTTIAIAGGVDIPAAAGNYDFIVAIKTSAAISNGDGISFGVAAGVNTYIMSVGNMTATALTAANSLTADTVAPQATSSGGPPDGQIGAPVEAMVDRVFSENLASGSVTTSTVLLQTNTGNVQGVGLAAGPNLCTSVTLSSNRIFCNHASLSINTWYTATFTTGITDLAGNSMQPPNFTSQFQTGSFGGGTQYNPPPFVLGTMPSPGGTLPINGRIAINFSSNMKTSGEGSVVNKANVMLHLLSSGVVTGPNILTDDVNELLWNSTNRQLMVAPRVVPPKLTADSYYQVTIQVDNDTNPGNNSCGGVALPACVMNTDNLAMQGRAYTINFRAVAADTTPPTISGSYPDSGATGVDRATDDFTISLNEALDPQSVTTSTVKLYCNDTNNNILDGCNSTETATSAQVNGTDPEVTGTSVVLDSDGRLIHLSPNQILPASSKFIIQIKGDGPAATSGVHDVVGNYNTDHSDIAIRTFTTGTNTNGQAADDTAPTVQFANADNFGIFITLSEAMKFNAIANTSQSSSDGVNNDVNNLSNWTIETSPDGSNWMAMPLTGKTVRYTGRTTGHWK